MPNLSNDQDDDIGWKNKISRRTRRVEILVSVVIVIFAAFNTSGSLSSSVPKQDLISEEISFSKSAIEDLNEQINSLVQFQENMNDNVVPRLQQEVAESIYQVSVLKDKIFQYERQSKKYIENEYGLEGIKHGEQGITFNDQLYDKRKDNTVELELNVEKKVSEEKESVLVSTQYSGNKINMKIADEDEQDGASISSGPNSLKRIDVDFDKKLDRKQNDAHRNLQKPNGNICHDGPLLSPINQFNNFTYDDKIDRALSIMYAISPPDLFADTKSPQYMAACWILYGEESENIPKGENFIQVYSMSVLYYSFFDLDEQSVPQALPAELCIIPGLECNDKNQITEITMGAADQVMKGTIPDEISFLRELRVLDMDGIGLTGTIPASLGKLSKLKKLFMGKNNFTGTIPTELGRLEQLQIFDASLNRLTGPIPSEFGKMSNLTELVLEQNNMGGHIPIELYGNKMITKIDLNFNRFSGSIATNVGQLRDLEVLKVLLNSMNGTMPSEFGHLTKLKSLWLTENAFTGTLPSEIGNMTSLTELGLSQTSFSGTIPNEFQDLQKLQSLLMESSQYSGSIPSSIWGLQNVSRLQLENNELTGSVPTEFCDRVGGDGISVDDSPWFNVKPKVPCACCSMINCYISESTVITIGDIVRPNCPEFNIHSFEMGGNYTAIDTIANLTKVGLFARTESIGLCLSPTGCYEIEYPDTEGSIVSYSLNHSKSKWSKQGACGAVTICGHQIKMGDTRRKGVNRLTQLAIPDLSLLDDENSAVSKAMCLILEQDEALFGIPVCDGTLLQKYVVALLYFMYDESSITGNDFNECDMTEIRCDEEQKIVKHIEFSNKNSTGTLITEIGLLPRLETIDFSNNSIHGTIDPGLLSGLSSLTVLNISNNNFQGEFPIHSLMSSKLKELDISQNSFVGTIPDKSYNFENLEIFNVRENILHGLVPISIFSGNKLKTIDLGQNDFTGSIPEEFGLLKNLIKLDLSANLLLGSIPNITSLHLLEELHLQRNKISGLIPSELTSFQNLTILRLSHNSLKGSIPSEFSNLKKIDMLHLHQNLLTGKAPDLGISGSSTNRYITDCGEPSFLQGGAVECDECSVCCNSEKKCQKNTKLPFKNEFIGMFLLGVLFPIALYFVMLIWKSAFASSWCIDDRSSLLIFNRNSVNCLIFTKDKVAFMIYFSMSFIQGWLFFVFLQRTNIGAFETAWIYSLRCLSDSPKCMDTSKRTIQGWVIFVIVTVLFIGADFVDSILQIRKAVTLRSRRFLISGIVLLFLTLLAFFTSIIYNTAVAESDTDLIVNTVILLFINDLDEKCLMVLSSACPVWLANRFDEIDSVLVHKVENSDVGNDEDGSNLKLRVNPRTDSLRMVLVHEAKEVDEPSGCVENEKQIAEKENRVVEKENHIAENEESLEFSKNNEVLGAYECCVM